MDGWMGSIRRVMEVVKVRGAIGLATARRESTSAERRSSILMDQWMIAIQLEVSRASRWELIGGR